MAQSLRQYLFTPVNNGSLVAFRILFGTIMLMEFLGDITSGWVKEVFIDSSFHFTFIGFEFLQALHGEWMYAYYTVAAFVSLMFATGLLYRVSSVIMALMWTAVYFSQKAHYNNHYYLMVLLCWLMIFTPANRRASLDVQLGLAKPTNECYRLFNVLFIAQIWIVYTYASVAKMYPDWLQARPVKIWFAKKGGYPLIGPLFTKDWFAYFIAYSGLVFDLLVVPALLWKRTRWLAVAGMLLFHLFNSIVFGIGVFPYLAMSLLVFFFAGTTFDNVLGAHKNATSLSQPAFSYQRFIICLLVAYTIWQVATPLRHYLYKGDVLWTEEGHRMSWRMMLRTKSGHASFTVKDKRSGEVWTIDPHDILPRYQANDVPTKPDFIWQLAQRLKNDFKKEGKDVAIYASAYCSLNGRAGQPLVDSTVDLASVPWLHFKHNPWVITDYK